MLGSTSNPCTSAVVTAIVGGRLHSTWKDGVAHQRGFLDDHAFLADAAVELLQARWRRSEIMPLNSRCAPIGI